MDLSDADPTEQVKLYDYRLVADFRVPEGIDNVDIVDLFSSLIARMKQASDNQSLDIYDAYDFPVELDALPKKDEFLDKFKVESLSGKVRKILVGFSIISQTTFSTLKSRLRSFLDSSKVFLWTHPSDLRNGIYHSQHGFIKFENPDTAIHFPWNDKFRDLANKAISSKTFWKKTDTLDKVLKNLDDYILDGTFFDIPISIDKGRISMVGKDKKMIQTDALVITSPSKYARSIQLLIDYIILDDKSIPALIPFGLRRHKPETYLKMIQQQCQFISIHRNIQVTQVSPTVYKEDISPFCLNHPLIHKSYYDSTKNKVHISTTKDSYLSVVRDIDSRLADYAETAYVAPFRVTRGSDATTNRTTKYGDLFDNDMSIPSAASLDNSTIGTSRSRGWNKIHPVKITFGLNEDEFPPLWKQSTPQTSTSTQPSQSPPSSSPLQDSFQAALDALDKKFDKKLDELIVKLFPSTEGKESHEDQPLTLGHLESTIVTIVDRVVSSTLQAILDKQIFTLQSDHSAAISRLDSKLDQLIESSATFHAETQQSSPNMTTTSVPGRPLESSSPFNNGSPTRPGKRPNQNTTPRKLFPLHDPTHLQTSHLATDTVMPGSED